ncbi:unnamed protein product [Angiostrongylus costaricensis]|uniref:Anion exchange protein n=1 Tax=Angiostrongylus costaricensis TaxID=334426 RepID=A0A0R3PL11_ANGCS|nr:unnamed protein product [Angiostrongylus costaricensis]
MRKLPPNTEGAAILVGRKLYPSIPDLPVPIRIIFILLSRAENYNSERISVGRTIAALIADEIFRKVALHCVEPYTLADATDEFLSQIVAVPPGICSQTRTVGMLYATYEDDDDEEGSGESHSARITRTGRLFGGLVKDLKAKKPWFISDFTDFFTVRFSQSLAATIFLFFANITSIITFGAVMERILHHQMASMEAILSGGISGVLFAAFSGQPLNILSATGPTLVFEKILFEFCIGNGWEFLPFRCWVGIWITVYLIILTATDMSALVGLISRFTEEAFATLISVVFIIQAFQKLIEISHDAPIVADPREVYESPCFCYLNSTDGELNRTASLRLKDVSAEECEIRGGEAVGLQCHFKPDVYMLSVLLTFGTFALAYGLNTFRNSRFFGSTPTLDRPWLIDISRIPVHVALISSLPAAFYTILIVMDQQITAVIINRKDNLLRKGHGYHLDLLVIGLLVLVCSFLGLPFYVAATVLSVMHVNCLRLYSESSAPGEIPRFLGVKEQRLTGVFAHILIGLSVFLTRVIKPDYSWLRSVKMRRVHLFTSIQLLSIGTLFVVKYTKAISMIFPLMVCLQ